MKLFVPGRICLFGEHSDWAGNYRRINSELEKGYTIICGTNQGIYAEVKPHPTKLIFRPTLYDGTAVAPYEISMNPEELLREAEKGDFFSYIAGVAYQMLTHFQVGGVEINNYLTDLPMKKGLSSSAAVSVLVTRAFNRLYNLKMSIRGEMEFAYRGETTTPSRCGRMDQGCAYGNRPIFTTFDGERIHIEEITVPRNMYFVIVDLGMVKNTQAILSQLNSCYPFARDEIQKGVQEYLGPISSKLTREAMLALQEGEAFAFGALMNQAQREFDKYCQPACASLLASPVLHKVLHHPPLQPYILGGKGVGSQGDGAAQFLAQDEQSQAKIIEIIERDFKMKCLKLVIQSNSISRSGKFKFRRPGWGTRFPAARNL